MELTKSTKSIIFGLILIFVLWIYYSNDNYCYNTNNITEQFWSDVREEASQAAAAVAAAAEAAAAEAVAAAAEAAAAEAVAAAAEAAVAEADIFTKLIDKIRKVGTSAFEEVIETEKQDGYDFISSFVSNYDVNSGTESQDSQYLEGFENHLFKPINVIQKYKMDLNKSINSSTSNQDKNKLLEKLKKVDHIYLKQLQFLENIIKYIKNEDASDKFDKLFENKDSTLDDYYDKIQTEKKKLSGLSDLNIELLKQLFTELHQHTHE